MFKKLFCGIFGSENAGNSVKTLRKPHRDASVEEWRNFINRAGWRQVAQIRSKFVPFAFGEEGKRDEQICNAMWERLFRIEQPVLDYDFLRSNADKIIFVGQCASNDCIKHDVRLSYAGEVKFVVEKGGKLRGFALSEDLILAGVTGCSGFPVSALKKTAEWGFYLLSREDSRRVEEVLPVLSEMMDAVDVPSLRDVFVWMLAVPDGQIGDPYECYSLRREDRFSYAEFDDPVVAVCKL